MARDRGRTEQTKEPVMEFEQKSLIDRLSPLCRKALAEAASHCVARMHYDIEIEHLFLKLAEIPNGDLARIVRAFDLDLPAVARELTEAVDRLKHGNGSKPFFSPRLMKLIQEG